MAHNKNRTLKMRDLEDKQLIEIIEAGTLRHAAARHELHSRGKDFMISGVDAKFNQSHVR